jgi:hypothetical protein
MATGKDTVTSNDITNAKKTGGELTKVADALHKRNAKDAKVVKFVSDVAQENKAIGSWKAGREPREQVTNSTKRMAVLVKTGKQLLSSVHEAEYVPDSVAVKLKGFTRPKFMHNASKTDKLPVWTFSAIDAKTKKPLGEVKIEMTAQMTKDEPTAKKMMADAAVAAMKKQFPTAQVKMVGNV